MNDPCRCCTVKGNMPLCKVTHCTFHHSWYAKEQQKKIKELENFITEVRDSLLYPLAHLNTEMGRIADGLGSRTIKILKDEE